MSTDLPDRLRTWAELDRIEATPVLRADLNTAADEIERLRTGITNLADELAAEHWRINPRTNGLIPDDEQVKFRTGCGMCWPHDADWPCATRMIADDLQALLTHASQT
jgi:hypothetical protein